MKQYLGVKMIKAIPMSGEEFDDRYKSIKHSGPGYLVEYEDGYKSWSPKDVFEKAYRGIDGLTFGLAIEAMKQGEIVARKGWNGRGMCIWYTSDNTIPKEVIESFVETNNLLQRPDAFVKAIQFRMTHEQSIVSSRGTNSYFSMMGADGRITPGWLASQIDMLAEDWYIIKLEDVDSSSN